MAEKTYDVGDVGLASYLDVLGYRLVGTRHVDSRVLFQFALDGRRDIAQDVASYMSGDGDQISASRFQAAANRLKREIRR